MKPVLETDIARYGGLEYRLGDLVHGYFDRGNATQFFCSRWPASIGCAYARRRRVTRDYDTLAALVRGGDAPPHDALVVHVRTGDVLDWPLYRDRFRCRVKCQWVRPVDDYARACVPTNISHIVLVSNPSYRTTLNATLSRAYLRALETLFNARGHLVRWRINASADDDLRYMANAHHLLPGKGRFADLVKRLARRTALVPLTCAPRAPGT